MTGYFCENLVKYDNMNKIIAETLSQWLLTYHLSIHKKFAEKSFIPSKCQLFYLKGFDRKFLLFSSKIQVSKRVGVDAKECDTCNLIIVVWVRTLWSL
jgi:hypothetical protein